MTVDRYVPTLYVVALGPEAFVATFSTQYMTVTNTKRQHSIMYRSGILGVSLV